MERCHYGNVRTSFQTPINLSRYPPYFQFYRRQEAYFRERMLWIHVSLPPPQERPVAVSMGLCFFSFLVTAGPVCGSWGGGVFFYC